LRFRPAARSPQMLDTSMSHLGFRCVVRPPEEQKQS
jgi:formylglycine-generating enzyme